MISMQSTINVAGLSGAALVDFMLHCTDEEYQAWWPGTHLAFHTVERRPGNVGNVVYMDEFVGKRRVRMTGVVTEVVPGKKLVWQFKKALRLPAYLILEVDGEESGVTITHTLQVGFRGIGRFLDPLFRLYFSKEFERAMDEHARTEFPLLRERRDLWPKGARVVTFASGAAPRHRWPCRSRWSNTSGASEHNSRHRRAHGHHNILGFHRTYDLTVSARCGIILL